MEATGRFWASTETPAVRLFTLKNTDRKRPRLKCDVTQSRPLESCDQSIFCVFTTWVTRVPLCQLYVRTEAGPQMKTCSKGLFKADVSVTWSSEFWMLRVRPTKSPTVFVIVSCVRVVLTRVLLQIWCQRCPRGTAWSSLHQRRPTRSPLRGRRRKMKVWRREETGRTRAWRPRIKEQVTFLHTRLWNDTRSDWFCDNCRISLTFQRRRGKRIRWQKIKHENTAVMSSRFPTEHSCYCRRSWREQRHQPWSLAAKRQLSSLYCFYLPFCLCR